MKRQSPLPEREERRVVRRSLVMEVLGMALMSYVVGSLCAEKLEFGKIPAGIIGLAVFGVGMFSVLKLKGSPRELWMTYGLKFLSVTAYKILNFTLVMWLTENLGFSRDVAFQWIVVWSVMMTMITLVAGSITDALGLKKTLLIGGSLCVVTRLVMVVTTNPWLALGCGLFPLAVGEALCTPVLVAALRKYSKPEQRSVAFSLFYALMNFGFMFGYFISDSVKEMVMQGGGGLGCMVLGPYQMLILVSLGMELFLFPLILSLRSNVEMTAEGLKQLEAAHDYRGMGWQETVMRSVKDAGVDTLETLKSLIRSKGFARLLVFLLMIGLLKIVFNAMDFVLPPFTKLELGPDARVGRLNAINGILILVLAPAIGVMTRKYSSYAMVVLGGFITAASFVFMGVPPRFFEGLTASWFGQVVGHGYLEIVGEIHPYYVMIFCWQVIFSIGEAFYSPRVYEYAASIAPKGQEASYASLSYVPLLIGKFVTGAAFGFLLERYCPLVGERDPARMWQIIGGMVAIAPIGLLVLRRMIQVEEER